jgi:hypothetical protein
MQRRLATVGLSILFGLTLILSMTACDSGTGYRSSSWYTPTFAEPLDGTAQAIALERFATQSAAEVQASQAIAEATVQAVIAAATAQAAQQQLEQQWALGTVQAGQATAAAESTRQALAATATHQAWVVGVTATARSWEATATAQSRWDAATATAQARSDAATATHQARSDMLTATADSYQLTRVAYHATATRQAQEREEVLVYGRDFGIPLVLLVLVAALAYLIAYGIRWLSRRPVVYPRDFRGDAQPVAVPTPDGKFVFIDLDRQPGHITVIRPDGTVEVPQVRDPGQEERTTARDQLLDRDTRPLLGPGRRSGQPSTMPLTPPPSSPPGLQRVLQVRRLELLGPGKGNILPGNVIRAIEARLEESEESGDDDSSGTE